MVLSREKGYNKIKRKQRRVCQAVVQPLAEARWTAAEKNITARINFCSSGFNMWSMLICALSLAGRIFIC